MRSNDVIGLIPCGGHATRIAPLPCSKELLPVGLRRLPDGSRRVKVVSHFLLEKMRKAGVQKAFFILRKGKWDIPEYYGDGTTVGMNLGYLIMGQPYGPAYTLDQAYPFVRGARVALGFPDILFGPSDAFERAMERLAATRADIVMGLYRAHDTRSSDMLGVDRTGRVREMLVKPDETKLKLGWVFAVWTSRFTEFMHKYLSVPRTAAEQPGTGLPAELTVGEVIQAAISEGLLTQSVVFPRRTYLDIGTPEDLRRVTDGSASSF
jgi:glucose-1-phosphate thymidylyltransferase